MDKYENRSRSVLSSGFDFLRLFNVIILLLLLALVVDGFGRPKSHKHHRKYSKTMNRCNSSGAATEKSANDNPRESTSATVDHDPYYKCDLVGFGVVQKISYETSTLNYNLIDVDLSSACIRCGMCLAIAQKINDSLMDVHDSSLSTNHQWLENNDQVNLFFTIVCNEQFRGYALREIDGKRYIGDSLPGAMLVATTADGRWENDLRSKCHDIVRQVGTRDLYKHWREWCDLGDFLCRSDAAVSVGLGDCRSIDAHGSKPENCQNFYGADVKVIANFGPMFF